MNSDYMKGWKAGVEDSVRQVKARQAHYELYRAKDDDDLVLAHIAMRTHPYAPRHVRCARRDARDA